MGDKAEQKKYVVWDDVGVVNEVLFASPHYLNLTSTLSRTSSPVDWLVLLVVDNGDRRERLRVELVTTLGLLHARAGGVDVSARSMDHKEEDSHFQLLCLFLRRSWRIAHGVRWDLS